MLYNPGLNERQGDPYHHGAAGSAQGGKAPHPLIPISLTLSLHRAGLGPMNNQSVAYVISVANDQQSKTLQKKGNKMVLYLILSLLKLDLVMCRPRLTLT